jgi:hypothetical protein
MGKEFPKREVGRRKGIVSCRATRSTGKGSQSTSLRDDHKSEDGRPSPIVGDPTGRSNPTNPTTHHRSGASHRARDPLRNKRSKRGHYSNRSWPIKNLCPGMQVAER